MAAPLFFVPVALAAGKVFFKFATKKAAQTFKGKFAKAGSVTTRTPAKNSKVTTTSSSNGQSIIKDMTKPTTMPRVSPRNPNTATLPKTPKSVSRAGAAASVGVAGSATSIGNAEKTKPKRKAPDRSADTVSRQQSQFAKRGSIDPKKPKDAKNPNAAFNKSRAKQRRAGKLSNKTAEEVNILLGGGMKKNDNKTSASPTSRPKNVPKREPTKSPKPRPKLYTTIDPKTGKIVDKKVTAAQHLSNIDKYKKFKAANKNILEQLNKASRKSKK